VIKRNNYGTKYTNIGTVLWTHPLIDDTITHA